MKSGNKISSKAKFAGTFLSLAFVSIALVLAIYVGVNRTFSWFMLGGNNTVTGMSVRTNADLFELGRVAADDDLPADLITYLQTDHDYYDLPETSAAHYAILCEFTNENRISEEGTEVNSIFPGAYGTVSFEIIPKTDGDLTLDISLNRIGVKYHETAPHYREVVNSVSGDVYDLLTGHILLFKSRTLDNDTHVYRYSNRLTDGFTFDTANLDADMDIVWDSTTERYTISLYWIWPTTFSQMTYDQSQSSMAVAALFGTDAAGASERAALLTYMNTHRSEFFNNLAFDPNTDFPNNFHVTYNTIMSEAYNNGDQLIGDNVDYFILEIIVEPQFAQASP